MKKFALFLLVIGCLLTLPLSADTNAKEFSEDLSQYIHFYGTITYHLNGGEAEELVNSYTDDEPVTFAIPTKTGYEFGGWYLTEDYSGRLYKTYEGQTGNLELYAKWNPITYTVTYNLDGGTNHTDNPTVLDYEQTTVTLQPALKNGYTFVRWYELNGEEKTTVTEVKGERDYELCAEFEIASAKEEETDTTEDVTTEPTEQKDGCQSVIGGATVILLLLALGFLATKKKGARFLSLLLVVTLLPIVTAPITTEAEEETVYTATRTTETAKRTLKILSVGNSFSMDQQTFVNPMAKAAGIDITVVNIYKGGCSFRTHYANAQSNEEAYTWYVNDGIVKYNATFWEIVDSDQWDFVTFQSGNDGDAIPPAEVEYLNGIMTLIREKQPNVSFVYNLTWPDSADSNRSIMNVSFHGNQSEMWEKWKDLANDAYEESGIYYITPCGLAYMYAKETYGNSLNRDTYHSSEYLRYIEACIWFNFFTGLEVPEEYKPVGPSYTGGFVLSDEDLAICRGYAKQAMDYVRQHIQPPDVFAGTDKAETLTLEGTVKTDYKAGELFDVTTFTATAVFPGNRARQVEITLNKTVALEKGDKEIILSYDGLDIVVPITVS